MNLDPDQARRRDLALRLLGDVAELCRAAGATPGEMDGVYSPRSWPDLGAGGHRSYSIPRPDPALLPVKVTDAAMGLLSLAQDLGIDLEVAIRCRVLSRRFEVPG
jgi:hypothetical protein